MNIKAHTHQGSEMTEGQTIQWAHQYDFLAKVLMLGQEKRFREGILRQVAFPQGAAVLDVGCGTGTLALLAKEKLGAQGKVYGIDASPNMIEVAQEKARQQKSDVQFQNGLIEALPFENGTFDVVLSSLMFHHLPDDLKKRGLAEIYRVLKPGGRLLIVDMRRPTNFAQHVAMAVMFHSGLTNGVQDLEPLMREIGYGDIQLKNMWGVLFGALQGQRRAA